NPWIHIPVGYFKTMNNPSVDWCYRTEPDPGLNGRRLEWPRGKVMGGSSSLNGLLYVRGQPQDYDRWAQMGFSGWSWDDVLPLFKRAENQERGADDYHGAGGPLNVSDMRLSRAICDAWVTAAQAAGFPFNPDYNGATQEGAFHYQVTHKNGERCSAAKAYLTPNLQRPNLTVLTHALTEKVLFEGRKAVGVQVKVKGQRQTLQARCEVILSAGAFGSPQLLMLSGVGPAAHLRQHGIDVIHDLPGVGENLQDHPDALVVHKSLRKDPLSLAPGALLTTGLKGFIDFFYRRTGQLTSNVAEAGGFIKSRPEETIPDLQLHLTAAKLDNHGLNLLFSMGYGYSGHVCILRPKSRGNITLRDANPRSPALIDPRFLEHPDDMEGMVRGVKAMRKIMAQDALNDWRGDEIFPGNDVESDEDIRNFLRQKCDNIYHPVGTCKMGNDDMAVVDSQLRVHGLEGLRVIDASIMPTLIGGNTNAPTVMIAEKGADAILGE
ncbi:GMC family oxidoreductase N-terminal domain-containing protein, partial [uncultured Alcanivorax sp.]|uniref:GMC family oxidoreductase n=1 Tax=uncultured Alcanivorax sp. TaxID=191215 RepID=UPI002631FF0E